MSCRVPCGAPRGWEGALWSGARPAGEAGRVCTRAPWLGAGPWGAPLLRSVFFGGWRGGDLGPIGTLGSTARAPEAHSPDLWGGLPGGRASPPRCKPVPPTPERPREAQPRGGRAGRVVGPLSSPRLTDQRPPARRGPLRRAGSAQRQSGARRGRGSARAGGGRAQPRLQSRPSGPSERVSWRGRGSRSDTAFPAPSAPERPGQTSPRGP